MFKEIKRGTKAIRGCEKNMYSRRQEKEVIEIISIVLKIKILMYRLKSRLGAAKERISELVKSEEVTQKVAERD